MVVGWLLWVDCCCCRFVVSCSVSVLLVLCRLLYRFELAVLLFLHFSSFAWFYLSYFFVSSPLPNPMNQVVLLQNAPNSGCQLLLTVNLSADPMKALSLAVQPQAQNG